MSIFDYIKKDLVEKIKEKQNELLSCDINSEQYTIILNEIELLRLELKEISNLNENKFNTIMTKYKVLKEKYNFLQELTMKQILTLSANTRLLNKKITEAYDNGIDFPDFLTDFKNEILINNIDYTKISGSETINKILEILNAKYTDFKKNVEEFYDILRNFKPNYYAMLEYAINNNNEISLQTLNALKGLGQDTLIEAIIEKNNIKYKIKNEPFVTLKTRAEKTAVVNKKINEYLNSLYKGIGLFIKLNYKQYKNKLGLTIDEFEEDDIEQLYTNILNQVADKNSKIKELIKKFEIFKATYKGFENYTEKNIKDMGIDLTEIKELGIDLYKLTKEDIFEILSQINIYTLFNKEKEKEEVQRLTLKVDEDND